MKNTTILVILGVVLIVFNLLWWFWLYRRVERWFFGSLLSRMLGVSIDRQPNFRSHIWRVVGPDRRPRLAQPMVTVLHIFFPVFTAAVSFGSFFAAIWVVSLLR